MRQIAFIACLLLFLAMPGAAWAQPAPQAEPAAQATGAEPLALLLDVLRDDAARAALIADLESRLEAEPEESEPQESEPQESEPEPSATAPPSATLGGQIAVFTQDLAQNVAGSFSDIARQMRAVPRMFSALGRADFAVLGGLARDLGLLVLATYGVYLALRLVTEHVRRRLRLQTVRSGWLAGLAAFAALLISNLAMVLGAWAAGQALAVGVLSETGRPAFAHALFLNAFLVVEAVQAVLRALLSPKDEPSRILHLEDADAKSLTFWSRLTLSVLAFGQLLLVPVFARYVAYNAGQAVSVIVYAVTLALLFHLVLRVRAPVAAWLEKHGAAGPESALPWLARLWHLPVLAYLLVLFATAILWPGPVLVELLYASVTIIVAAVLGIAAATLLSRLVMLGFKLPSSVSSRVPRLEQRLNAVVPRALTALRLLVFAVVAAITLDAVGLFSVSQWLESEYGGRVATATITVGLILSVAFGAWLALSSWVDYQIQPARGRPVNARKRTLLTLLRNAATIAIVLLAAMFSLSEIGLDIAPLLASAGVIGLAVGFGAQRLVQDIITGIFIQLEGAMDVGDVVSIGGITGRVERLTIRSAGLRDDSGVYHIIPFSSVTTVSNFMRGFAYAVSELSVANQSDIDAVRQAMSDAFDQLRADPRFKSDIVATGIDWMGLERFTDAAMVVRARIKTLPGKQWGVQRAFNAALRTIFAERGIKIP